MQGIYRLYIGQGWDGLLSVPNELDDSALEA